tara:strand:+ start:561 stop:1976 length:1416 start_codon:yes stop_codon:yes gene_type:complete
MLNPFFLQGSKSEQGLIQDLVNEHLKIFGIDVYYLPRQYVNEKTIIKEVIESEFNFAYPIEAYVDSYDGYGGQGTVLSKFGIQELDDLNLIISKERWENYIKPLIKNLPNVKLSERPKEGDLIYFPLGDKLFEIKYVEHEKPFYQLQKNYVYELRCELFRYEDEVVNSGIDFIDDNLQQEGFIQTLQMVGVGSTASAITSIVNGGVRFVTITNRGSGYKSPPTVAFSSAPLGGVTATGIATMISGITDICEPDQTLFRVQGIQLTNPGSGYTVAPKIAFISNTGSGAEATTILGNGIVGVVTITNGGSGYVNSPPINFSGISSISASGYSVVGSGGSISQIRITNAGLGYAQSPIVTIGSPSIMVGTGVYKFNEVVIGNQSGTRARVKLWSSTTGILEVSNIDGSFILGEVLIGQTTGANYSIKEVSKDNLADISDPLGLNKTDKYSQNKQIEIEASQIVDFSERNPFGTP